MNYEEVIVSSSYYELRRLIGSKGQLKFASKKIAESTSLNELEADILRSQLIMSYARPIESLSLINNVIEKINEKTDQLLFLHALWTKCYSLLMMGNVLEVKKTLDGLNIDPNIDDLSLSDRILTQEALAWLYQVKASCYGLYLADYKKGIELGKRALALAEAVSAPDIISWVYYILCAIYQHKEDVVLGLKYGEKGVNFSQEKDFKIPLALIYISIGRIYGIKGDNTKLIEYMNKAFHIGNETGNKVISNLTTGEIGHFYASKGLYDQSIEQFNLGLQLAKERDDTFVVVKRLNDLGQIHHLRGELTQALNNFRECLVLSPTLNNKFFESRMFYAIGSIHFDQGKCENAFEMFKKSKSILSTLAPQSLLYSSVLYALVMLNLELGQLEQVNEHLNQLRVINSETNNQKIKLTYQLAQALKLKASPRLKNRVKAQEIFERIGEKEGIEHNILTFVWLNQCDLLISEYKSTGEKEIFDEIMELSQRLYSIGREKNAFPTIIKALLLQSKLFLIEGNLEKLEDRLNEAFKLAESRNLVSLLNQINHEQEKVNIELGKWKTLLVSNASLQERVSAAALENYIKSVKQLVHHKEQDILKD